MIHRPNILFINADQLRYDCIGSSADTQVKTPNLDLLAEKGMRFSYAYTPLPSCCPARQTLLSGIMPEQHKGLWNYGGGGSLPVERFSSDLAIWPRQLRDSGYRTAYLGKWHVNPDLDPAHFGFESFDEPPNDGFGTPHKTVKYPVNNPWPEFPIGMCESLPVEECHTHVLARKCIEKIEEFKADPAPWHIRLDFSEPHLPCVPAEPFASMYPPETIPEWKNFRESFEGKPYIQKQQIKNWCIEDWGWTEWSIYLSGYFGTISQMDDAVGKVLQYLDQQNLLKDTLIIFTADHGDAAGSHRMMDKHYVMYEEETHVPLLMRWDGVIPPGTVCSDFLSHYLDLPVTLLELLDLPIPQDYQGRSFLPQLKGQPAENARELAFSSYNGQQFGLYCQRMIRDRRFKYIWNATDTDELYDLETDPWEMKNLASGNEDSELCRTYRRKLYTVFETLNDPLVTGFWNRRQLLSDRI